MIQRHLLRSKKLHFRKAFDLILHCKLWPILIKTGVKEKTLQTIQSMQRIIKAPIHKGGNV